MIFDKKNRLTWKYFFIQKYKEITEFFTDLFSEIVDLLKDNWPIFMIISMLFGFFCMMGWTENYNGEPCAPILGIVGLCIFGFWILIGFILLLKTIYEWLRDNWKRASRRAEKELNNIKKQ